MKKTSGICLSLLSTIMQGAYYGPPQVYNDGLQSRMAQRVIESNKSLENAISTRPHVTVHTYHHQDHSTQLRFADNKAPIYVSHGNQAPAPRPGAASTPQDGQSPSWWRRWLGWFGGGNGQEKQTQDGFFSNKRDLTYKALVLGYAYINFRLFRTSAYLQEAERWFLWKQEFSLAQLIALPQAEIARFLVADIRERYEQRSTQQETENPFGRFMKVLEEEETALHSYQTLSAILLRVDDLEHRCLEACCNYMPKVYGISLSYAMTCLASKIRVKTLFYLDDALLQSVPERLARLAYLKTVFSDWLASHKLHLARRKLAQGRASLSCLPFEKASPL